MVILTICKTVYLRIVQIKSCDILIVIFLCDANFARENTSKLLCKRVYTYRRSARVSLPARNNSRAPHRREIKSAIFRVGTISRNFSALEVCSAPHEIVAVRRREPASRQPSRQASKRGQQQQGARGGCGLIHRAITILS